MGVGTLVKPSPPTTGATNSPRNTTKGAVSRTPPPKSPAAVRPASTSLPAPGEAEPLSLGDPKKIARCLAPLGFKTGELQKVPLNLWQSVSPKFLADGDVNLFVSGASASTVSTVELDATAGLAGIAAARSELLRALPVLMKELNLSMPGELTAALENNAAAGTNETSLAVAGVKIQCVARILGDQRSVCVRFTRAED